MKVAFDISPLGVGYRKRSDRTGIYRAVHHLLRGLIGSDQCDMRLVAGGSFEILRDSVAFVHAEPGFESAVMRRRFLNIQVKIERILRGRRNGRPGIAAQFATRVAEATRALLGGRRGPLDQRVLSRADIYHSPFFPLPEQTGRAARVLTCYDLIPIKHPELVQPSHTTFAKEILRSVKPTDWVICDSQAVREDLCNYLHFDSKRTFVTYLAADPAVFRPAEQTEIDAVRARYSVPPGPYLLSVATLDPRRNIRHLRECFAKLIAEQHIDDLSLVLVGHKAWGATETQAATRASAGRVVVTGYVPDRDLAPLYSGAIAFVYPSLSEGFGLTPLEAMQCGAPVIASNTSSLPEVVGDAAIQVDPVDADALCAAMLRLYQSAALRKDLSARSIERAKHFTWEHSVNETIGAYRTALEGRG